MTASSDALYAAGAGAAALVVYARTLAPGLIALLDTPMFQFIGRVLGVPHNPGYPLYVLLTHPVSLLPFGSLPYRINAFSALLGAVAVSLVFLIARRLGCGRIVSLAAAWGLASGRVFWSQAVIAEVYTLHAAIVAGVLLALLAWGQTRRNGYFFGAIAVFAAGLGNHTTIVALAPGMAAYALMTDRRFVTRARTLATSAAIVSAGILQYGFILIRSHQPGVYLESRATTVRELLNVMLGRQFQDRLFAFEWQAVIRDRLPSLVEHVLAPELTIPGLVLATVGAVWLLRHRLAEGLLLLPTLGIIVGFAANYRVVDTPVFLIPGILVLWVAAAAGADRAARFAGRVPWGGLACSVAVLTVPLWNVAHNYAANDRSRDTSAATRMDALFRALPARTVLVHEDFLVDRLVMFKLLGDESARGRQIELAPRDPVILRTRLAAGFDVFAFRNSARRLRQHAVNVSHRPLTLAGGVLPDFLLRLADGMVVAIAVPSFYLPQFVATGGAAFTAIGGPDRLPHTAGSNVAITGTRGDRDGAVVRTDSAAIDLNIPARLGTAGSGAAGGSGIQIHSREGEAAIREGSRDIVRTTEGAAVAVWTPQGGLAHAFVLQARDAFRVPIAAGPLSVYPLRGLWSGQELRSDGWADLSATMRTGSVMVRVPPGGTAVIYASDDAPLSPRVIDRSAEGARIEITGFGEGDRALRTRIATDEASGAGLDSHANTYRVEVHAPEAVTVSALIALGGVPVTAIGRAPRAGAKAASVFSIDTAGLLRTPDAVSEVLLMARDEQAQLTGHGWSAVDHDRVGAYRWMTASEARLVLPIAGPAPTGIRLQATLESTGAAATVRLRVNRTELPAQSLRTGWHAYEWSLPSGSVAPGTNEAVVIVEGLPLGAGANAGARGVALSEVRVMHSAR